MSLTGWLLPVLIGLVALVLLVPLVLGLPRSKGAASAAVRAGQLFAFTLSVLLLVGLGLNHQEKFFADWGDLWAFASGNTPTGQTASYGAPVASATTSPEPTTSHSASPTTSHTPTPTPTPELPPLPSAERDQTFEVTGGSSGFAGTIRVILPEGYDPKAATPYPVIMAIHGFPGDQRTWLTKGTMNLLPSLDDAVHRGLVKAPIVVLPQASSGGVDAECINDANGGHQLQTWLGKDVPQWVRDHLRVSPTRDGWAVSGFSAGGYCSALIGLDNPSQFGALQVFGGYFRPTFDGHFRPASPEVLQSSKYDLIKRMAEAPVDIAVWAQAARKDSVSFPTTQAFLEQVKAPATATAVFTDGGGHAYSFWRPHVVTSLEWLGATLAGFRPGT